MNSLLASQPYIPIMAPIGAGLAVAFGTFTYGMLSPTSRMFGPVILRGPDGCGSKIALTFDDGPTRAGTGPILDTLDELKCPATFFFIGHNVQKHPDLVRRATSAGHQVENHSFDHPRLGILRRGEYWKRQWRLTDAAIAAAGGPPHTTFFRPPMGFKSWRMTAAAKTSGVRMVAWSLRAMDGVPTTHDAILHRILPRAQAGDIIALHDGHEPHIKRDPAATVAALPSIIRGLRDKGLEPVLLSELVNPGAAKARTIS